MLYSADVIEGATPRLTWVSNSGYERASVIVDPALRQQLIAPAAAQAYRARLRQVVTSIASEFVSSFVITHRFGERRRTLNSARHVRNPRGRALELVGAWLELIGRSVPD